MKIIIKTDRGRLGLIRTNLAYALVDAANTLLIDAEQDFKSEGLVLRHEQKQKLSLLKNAVNNLKIRCKDFAIDAYKAKNETEVENFCEDSDFLANFLLTVVDRSGNDNSLFNKLYYQVFNSKSVLNLFK